ncbi:MAG: sensor domain-containing diguanylate cyclase [Pseudomonadota bacterium]
MQYTESLLYKLADVVSETQDMESLVRPLLELLETVTGLESTYFTAVNEAAGFQSILYSRNTKSLNIPEGLSVPWGDTLCKRALEEGRAYTNDVGSCWGDSDAARLLGITTYLSEPVRMTDSGLYGTLCAASASSLEVSSEAIRVLKMFSQLISHQLERERLVVDLKKQNQEYSRFAMQDPLTGVLNRRALNNELTKMLARAARESVGVHIAFLDMDGFKQINDQYGHDIGDRFLMQVAGKLVGAVREGDLVARYGGDEFVVAIASAADAAAEREELRTRVEQGVKGFYLLDNITLNYGGASVGIISAESGDNDVQALLASADAAMYEVKKSRKKVSVSA